MRPSQIIQLNKFPTRKEFPDETVLFFDSILKKYPLFNEFSKKFKYKIALTAGESLKSIRQFEKVSLQISRLDIPHTTALCFLSVGGGSVGDFVGFLASVYLRGRTLVHMPTTWLAAVDSAHGGKNGLNLNGKKNQIGSYYPAQSIYLIESLFEKMGSQRMNEALGEVIKIAIINDRLLFRFLELKASKLSSMDLFKKLPQMIQNKMKVVAKDPFEKLGFRRVLNLGHTMGHVFESYYKRPHGECVMLGILFAVRWSYFKKICDEATYIKISNLIELFFPDNELSLKLKKISHVKLIEGLTKDKKITSKDKLDFIFIQKIGQVIRISVSVEDICNEVKRQCYEY